MERRKKARLLNRIRALETKGLTKGVMVVAMALLSTVTDGAVHYGLLGAVAVLFCLFIAEADASAREIKVLRKKVRR